MKGEYLYETFSAESTDFDKAFTDYLNSKRGDHWKVRDCSYCHDDDTKRLWASCIFQRKAS